MTDSYYEATTMSQDNGNGRFIQGFKSNPIPSMAFATCLSIAGYSIYNIKNRRQPLSLYLINTRVVSQGTFCIIMIGFASYMSFKKYINPPKEHYFQGKLVPYDSNTTTSNAD